MIIASGKRLKRPFRLLYPLEGNCFIENSDKTDMSSDEINKDMEIVEENDMVFDAKVTRKAASIARETIRALSK